MRRTRGSPSSIHPAVTLYSLVSPAASSSSASSASAAGPSTATRQSPRKTTRSAPTYLEDLVKDEPRDDDDEAFVPASPPGLSSASPDKKPKLASSPVKRAQASAWKPPPEPPRWKQQYEAIVTMRSTIDAPVDTMGCAAAGAAELDPVKARFAVLISLMLSSQTKDEMTHRAMGQLRTTLPGGLSARSLLEADDGVIKTAISSVGFANRKTIYIKEAARDVLDKHGGDIPPTIDGLLALKGVGPKMGHLVMEYAWNKSSGIGVDIHVERITNRLGWHPKKTNTTTPTPELARKNLESWLPAALWGPINPLLVGFGQTICKAVAPLCSVCDLGTQRLCPSYDPAAKGRAEAKAKREASASISPTKARKLVKVEVELDESVVPPIASDTAADESTTVVWTEEVKRERAE